MLEAKLALGDIGVFGQTNSEMPTFGGYADSWMKDHAKLACRTSTIDGYRSVLKQHLRPRFASIRLDQIKRNDIKDFINALVAKKLARGTLRNALSILRSIFNNAIEDGLFESNPAANLGRFTKAGRISDVKGVALTSEEVEHFLETAARIFPVYGPLFLLAVRGGLRRGELVAIEWGDIEFGKDDKDSNRFILVQHNFVRREHTSTKSGKARRVDMSRELRRVLIGIRDARLNVARQAGRTDISREQVFPAADGTILDPDNLYHRVFVPILKESGLRHFRLHDLRHTFGSLLIQRGASVVYVKEQMGRGWIQITVDTYGHLIPGANVSFIDLLDKKEGEERPRTRQTATPAQSAAGAAI